MTQDAKPYLSTDVEREIFETTGLLYPNTIPTLLRVARRVSIWVEPLLYRVLRISRYSPLAGVVLDAVHSKPTTFLRTAVRHLLLDGSAQWSQDDALSVLRLCTGLVSLLPFGRFASPALLPVLREMRSVRRLSASLEDLFGSSDAIDLHHPLFSGITHLDIFDPVESAPQIYVQLSALPRLTHLCLNNDIPAPIAHVVLSSCPHLEVLVNMWAYLRLARAFAVAQSPPLKDPDPRFVVALYDDFSADWEAGSHDELDFWALAEIFVARKRRGQIPASCYWLQHLIDSSSSGDVEPISL
ncbi:hypothetical protein DFH07DRAFT_851208 [Mycena maculata]|uniref:Uncharacterized protein n=1 Tax=Mycena maculata TaxID=230809 RepID=A0AAD7HTV9_9AGAR|nr:hypothetical protein DFH07DRAFT_851208 [Mycena maculata]